MFHIFVYEHCFTISLVRNLESNVLTYLNKYGKERIGKAPHIGEYAWLNVCTHVSRKQKFAIWRRDWESLYLKFTRIF